MSETVVLRWNYQIVNHRRIKRLHRQIDIAGIIWNHALALQKRYYRLSGGYISKNHMMGHLLKLRRGVSRYQYW